MTMGIRSIDHDTMPCPPPDESNLESGEFESVSLHDPVRLARAAPRYAQLIEEEVRERLAGVRCPEHGEPPVVEFSVGQNGAVQVTPLACCDQLDRLVLAALRGSITLAPPSLPDW
jgi:hypothetical protein